MNTPNEKPPTKAEFETAEKKALPQWRQQWTREQSLRDQYCGDEDRFLANQRARLRSSMLTRGVHTRSGG